MEADLLLFLTLSPPTEPMRIAVTAAGFYETYREDMLGFRY
jgi:hypothetical protein